MLQAKEYIRLTECDFSCPNSQFCHEGWNDTEKKVDTKDFNTKTSMENRERAECQSILANSM